MRLLSSYYHLTEQGNGVIDKITTAYTWLKYTPDQLKKWLGYSLLGLVSLVLVAMFCILTIDRVISWRSQDAIYYHVDQVPPHDIGLVLGTSKYIGRTLNTYYSHRIDAAITLYQQGKISELLLSGDNAHRSYNEPWTMKRDMLKAGIPDDKIHLDYAGFRTLDSIVRAKQIFQADDFLIITQAFHCERAIFIAHYHNIQATCLAVPGPNETSGFNVRLREIFARTKAILDLYVFQAKPKFLGPIRPIMNLSSNQTEN